MSPNGNGSRERRNEAEVRRPRYPLITSLALGMGIWVTLRWIGDQVEIGAGEPGLLRWARKLGEHPLRGSVAIGLLVHAFRGF